MFITSVCWNSVDIYSLPWTLSVETLEKIFSKEVSRIIDSGNKKYLGRNFQSQINIELW